MALFLALTFGITWPAHLLARQLGDGPAGLALFALGGFAPLIAALVVTRGAVWRQARRPPVWGLALGFAGASLLAAIAGLATGALSLEPPMLLALLLPPFAEEFGWRGLLQPRLVARLGGLGGSLAVGAIWALWHASTADSWPSYPPFALSLALWSVVIGWLWQRAGRSTWVAVAAHAGINLGVVHAPPRGAFLVVLGAAAALAAVAMARTPRPAR